MRNLLPCSLNELELMPVAGVTQGEFLKPHFPLLPLNKYQLTSTSVVHATSRLPQGTLGSPTSLNHLTVHSISSDLQDRPLLDMARGLNWAEKNVRGSLSRMLQWQLQLYVTCMNATMASVCIWHWIPFQLSSWFVDCRVWDVDGWGLWSQSFVLSWDVIRQYLGVSYERLRSFGKVGC